MKIRKVTLEDAADMAVLLNEIIRIGGTTAITVELSEAAMKELIKKNEAQAAWHLADDNGAVKGFQWIAPHPELPPEICDIATFVKVGATKSGIGSKLMAATVKAAKELGYTQINARIRADNEGGLTYYTRQGFTDFDTAKGIKIGDGTIVDKVIKRRAI